MTKKQLKKQRLRRELEKRLWVKSLSMQKKADRDPQFRKLLESLQR